ncbi:hypothetical protein H9P43_007776 [Blastocladiella emersonii ATCC 22665]|nr:hypothetical protein H9P43_007776 [Blastocladiella emersonii ATCC 22665]
MGVAARAFVGLQLPQICFEIAPPYEREQVEFTSCCAASRVRPIGKSRRDSAQMSIHTSSATARRFSKFKLVRLDLIESTSKSAVHSRIGCRRSPDLGLNLNTPSCNITMSIIGLLKLVKDARCSGSTIISIASRPTR